MPFFNGVASIVSSVGLDKLKALSEEVKAGQVAPCYVSAALEWIHANLQHYMNEQIQEDELRQAEYVSIQQAAEILGKSRQSIYQKIQRGTIPPGSYWRSANGRTIKILVSRLKEFK